MTYNPQGKRIRSENLAGRIATKVAQGEGGLGLKTDMAYTVKHIQKGPFWPFGSKPMTKSVMGRKYQSVRYAKTSLAELS